MYLRGSDRLQPRATALSDQLGRLVTVERPRSGALLPQRWMPLGSSRWSAVLGSSRWSAVLVSSRWSAVLGSSRRPLPARSVRRGHVAHALVHVVTDVHPASGGEPSSLFPHDHRLEALALSELQRCAGQLGR